MKEEMNQTYRAYYVKRHTILRTSANFCISNGEKIGSMHEKLRWHKFIFLIQQRRFILRIFLTSESISHKSTSELSRPC